MTKFSLTLSVAAIALLPITLAAQQAPRPAPAPTPTPAPNPASARAGTAGDTIAFPGTPDADEIRRNERVDQRQNPPPPPTDADPDAADQDQSGQGAPAGGGSGSGSGGTRGPAPGVLGAGQGSGSGGNPGMTPAPGVLGGGQGSGSGGNPGMTPAPGVMGGGRGTASGGNPGMTPAPGVIGGGRGSGTGGNPGIPRTGTGTVGSGQGSLSGGGQGGQGGQGGGGGSGSGAPASGQYWPTPQPRPAPPPSDITPILDMSANFGAIPDPFLKAVDLVRGLGPRATEADFTRITGIRIEDIQKVAQTANTLAADTEALQRRVNGVKAELAAVTRTMEGLRNTLGAGISNEALINGFGPIGLATLRAQEERARQLVAQIGTLDAAVQRNLQAGHRISQQLGSLSTLKTALESRGILRFANGLTGAIERLKLVPVFSTLGGIGSIASVYGSASALGNFDPGAAGDLQLSGKYDSNWGNVKDVTLTLLGLAANAATGNVPGATTDFLTILTGRATDTYMAYQAWQAADAEAEVAHRRYLLTLMKRDRLINDRQIAEDRDRLTRINRTIADINNDLDNRRPNPARDPDWRDPRFDPDTGLPIPAYWRYLRANNPQALRDMGIDPDAPVGGWPNGVRPQDRPRQTATVQPRIPTGPGYPTARPRTPRAADDGPDGSGAIDDAAEDVDDAEPEVRPTPASQPFTPRPKPPKIDLTLDVTPLDFDPVTFEPVTFTGPEWKPPVWTPVEFKPPEWVPVKFNPPKPLKLDWMKFDKKSQYPGSGDNLSYDFGDLSGKVATDLSPWEEWLATQNVNYLTQLALAAGYPNLAAALADARNLMRQARDTGFRQWAFAPPVGTGAIGIWASEAQHNLARAQVLLGDLLGQSRDIFSTGGLTDIGISGTDLAYIIRDFGLEDGDLVDITVEQFGRTIFTTRLSLLNRGTEFLHLLKRGVARLVITAVNEGAISPNTAELNLKNVVRGNATQTYSLRTGDQAVLRIETNAPTRAVNGE